MNGLVIHIGRIRRMHAQRSITPMDDLYPFVEHPQTPKTAVIGSGIAGLSAAWLLSRTQDVTLYEAADRAGGHAHTVDIPDGRGGISPVDTGFIVYNTLNYPDLTALYRHFQVQTEASCMSFSASLEGGTYEYNGKGLWGLLGAGRNTFNVRAWQMVFEILKLYRNAGQTGRETYGLSLGEFLSRHGFSRRLAEDHLVPMCAAIWSCPANTMLEFPAESFLRFFENHGLFRVRNRPEWRTVTGGSRSYVQAITRALKGRVCLSTPVQTVERQPHGVIVHDATGRSERFDNVVLATHPDTSLQILSKANRQEQSILSAIGYQPNEALLHTDPVLMPQNRKLWSSWNYRDEERQRGNTGPAVTYWMNRLQNLALDADIFLSLNPGMAIDESRILGRYYYDHPVFDRAALTAQKQLPAIQGHGGIWYCGAWCGYGFHEDGAQSGLAVAEAIGGLSRPWKTRPEGDRIGWTAADLKQGRKGRVES